MNLSAKSKKNAKSSEKKKKLSVKSTITSVNHSKPISARDKRNNIRKKLFSNKKESPLKILNYHK